MKKKILLVVAIIAVLIFTFAVVASAETENPYIEFEVKLSGGTDYITAYAPNSNSSSPTLSLDSEFYSDNDLTTVISKDSIVGIDLSSASAKNSDKTVVTSFVTATTPFANCKEIKWFGVKNSCTTIPASAFKNWTALESFEFGVAMTLSDSAFSASGLTSISIPAGATLKGSEFYDCKSLKSVVFEGAIYDRQYSKNNFYGCSALETVDLGSLVALKDYMFQNCTSLKTVVLPSTLTSIPKGVFMGCTGLESIDLGQVQSMNESAFKNCTSLKEVTLPSTFTTTTNREIFYGCSSLKRVTILGNIESPATCMFAYCTSLEYVEIQGSLGVISSEMFQGCSSLKAISLPEGCTTIKSRAFAECTALQAVYLPSTLTTIGHDTTWGRGAFNDCTSVYFVQKPFSVKDENGNWLGESFVQPTRESVYYMPSGLTTVYSTEFRTCRNLNDVVVFPTTLTSITAWEGSFSASGTSACPKTYVFLGDMTKFCFSGRDGRYDNISFMFANPNDKDIESMTFQLGYRTAPKNSYAYFCAGETYYNLNSFTGSTESYVVSKGEFTEAKYTEDLAQHIHSPKDDETTEATCELAEGKYTYCFCGKTMTSDVVEGSEPLGHQIGETYLIYYPTVDGVINYFADSHICYTCTRTDCGKEIDNEQTGTALFTEKGYSKENGGNTFTYGIKINKDAKEAYVANGNIISYGFIVGAYSENTTGAIINADGTTTLTSYVKADLSSEKLEGFTIYNLKMKDLTDDQKSQSIYCCGYIIDDGEVSYLGETVTKVAGVISYDAIPADTTSTDEKESA